MKTLSPVGAVISFSAVVLGGGAALLRTLPQVDPISKHQATKSTAQSTMEVFVAQHTPPLCQSDYPWPKEVSAPTRVVPPGICPHDEYAWGLCQRCLREFEEGVRH